MLELLQSRFFCIFCACGFSNHCWATMWWLLRDLLNYLDQRMHGAQLQICSNSNCRCPFLFPLPVSCNQYLHHIWFHPCHLTADYSCHGQVAGYAGLRSTFGGCSERTKGCWYLVNWNQLWRRVCQECCPMDRTIECPGPPCKSVTSYMKAQMILKKLRRHFDTHQSIHQLGFRRRSRFEATVLVVNLGNNWFTRRHHEVWQCLLLLIFSIRKFSVGQNKVVHVALLSII